MSAESSRSDGPVPRTWPEWDRVDVGLVLATLDFRVTYTTMVLDVAGTRDLYPPHHDPDAARAHGAKTIFLTTMWFQGLVGRFVSDWAGPNSFLRRLGIEMLANCGPGDTLTVSGRVTARRIDERQQRVVDLDIGIAKQDGVAAVRASATVELWPA